MKKYWKTVFIFTILIALGVGYYYYLANKDAKKDATDYAANAGSETNLLISRDILKSYPESPKELVELNVRINKAFYEPKNTEEQTEALGRQVRLLWDDELLALHPEEKYMQDLKADIEKFRSVNAKISSYAIQSATKTKYTTKDGKQYASIIGVYYIRENNEIKNSYTRFMMRKNEEGKWKILYWELVDSDDEFFN